MPGPSDWIQRIAMLIAATGSGKPLAGTSGQEFTQELQRPQNDELAKLDRLLQQMRLGQ